MVAYAPETYLSAAWLYLNRANGYTGKVLYSIENRIIESWAGRTASLNTERATSRYWTKAALPRQQEHLQN